MGRAAIFLDRDGVICQNRADYVKSWDEFVFVPGAIEACVALRAAGLTLVVITNQSAIGRGILSRTDVDTINALMLQTLADAGASVDGVFVCPHAPGDGCVCRKPAPGLLLRAAAAHGLDLERSWLVGDAATDIEAALRAGCGAVMVRTGRGADQLGNPSMWNGARPAYIADDLTGATQWLLTRRSEVSRP